MTSPLGTASNLVMENKGIFTEIFIQYIRKMWRLQVRSKGKEAGFHTGFLAGGGRNTDSTCVGMHEMMFTRKHVCKLETIIYCYHNYRVVTCYKLYILPYNCITF